MDGDDTRTMRRASAVCDALTSTLRALMEACSARRAAYGQPCSKNGYKHIVPPTLMHDTHTNCGGKWGRCQVCKPGKLLTHMFLLKK